MIEPGFDIWLTERRRDRDARGLGRRLAALAVRDGHHAEIGGRRVLLFATNDHLDALLAGGGAGRRVVVTDGVFSMDGDIAPLPDLVAVCRRHGALLVVDEAHVRVATLGKAVGAHGGFIATSARIREHVLNSDRAFIYSTALPVAIVAAARAALRVFRSEPALRERLRAHISILAGELGVAPGSAIFPVVLGREEDALLASRRLLDRGLLVPGVRPPTVPEGSSRLRVTLSAAHTGEELAELTSALAELGHLPGESR